MLILRPPISQLTRLSKIFGNFSFLYLEKRNDGFEWLMQPGGDVFKWRLSATKHLNSFHYLKNDLSKKTQLLS